MTVYPQSNDNFSQKPDSLDYDLQDEKRRIAEGTEEIKKELWEIWKGKYAQAEIFPPAIKSLHPLLIDFLLSFQHTLFYNELRYTFKLNQAQRNALPVIAWNICLNKKWETTENYLQTELSLPSQISSQIASLINQTILSRARELTNKPFISSSNKINATNEIDSKISLPLSEALKIHPEVGEQLVTSDKINLRNFPYPVRPSIKNWLADYTFHLGYEKHGAIERSQYLFQGANTKNLSTLEKQKLSYLLKSFDENSLITVNKNIKQVIFPARNVSPASNASRSDADWHSDAGGPASETNYPSRPAITPPSEQKNINSMQFSYRQTLPYEKNTAPTSLPSKIPAGSQKAERISQGEPQNLPKNVVDLKSITPL